MTYGSFYFTVKFFRSIMLSHETPSLIFLVLGGVGSSVAAEAQKDMLAIPQSTNAPSGAVWMALQCGSVDSFVCAVLYFFAWMHLFYILGGRLSLNIRLSANLMLLLDE